MAKTPRLGPHATRDELEAGLDRTGYITDPRIVLSLWLALELERPLLVEGPAGVGKTQLAKAAAQALEMPLIRLQCYEGLDESKSLYEWDYAKQMLYTQLLRDAVAKETAGASSLASAADVVAKSEATFFDRRFLLARPLLQAIESPSRAVLLIDEVDRADPEFEAFLLEVLSEMAVTIPEIGTVRALHPPLVILTTNGTRDMTEALRRRCLHAYLDYPSPSREVRILEARIPGVDAALVEKLVAFTARLRALDLRKAPSVSESIDWARALMVLGAHALDPESVRETLGVLLKHQDDRTRVEEKLGSLLGAVS